MNTIPVTDNRCLRPSQAAEYLGLSVDTIDGLRKRDEFVPEIRLTRVAIGYRVADLDAWLEARRRPAPSRETEAAGE